MLTLSKYDNKYHKNYLISIVQFYKSVLKLK